MFWTVSGEFLGSDAVTYFNSDPAFMIVPIQIRAGVRVDVRLPRDLTTSEAGKVAAVVQALAAPDGHHAAGYERQRVNQAFPTVPHLF